VFLDDDLQVTLNDDLATPLSDGSVALFSKDQKYKMQLFKMQTFILGLFVLLQATQVGGER
jgi:hypothetical protein